MTQNSRQALIELLFLSLYLDNELSMAEDAVLNQALDSLGWDSPQPREQFIFATFSKARAAAADAILTEEYLTGRTDVIIADGEQAGALTWLSRVLTSDGVSSDEKRFLDEVQKRLYPDEGAM